MTIRQRIMRHVLEVARQHATSGRLALATSLGVFIGTSPFYGLHFMIGVGLGRLFRLNQLAILIGEQVSLPIVAPFLFYANVQMGHLILRGQWMVLDGHTLAKKSAGAFLLDWWVGSLVVGFVLAVLLGAATYGVIEAIRKKRERGWSGRSRGTGLGYAIFRVTLRVLGRRGGYALLYVVLPYYMLFAVSTRRHSNAYLTRVLGPRGFWRRQRDTWRHLMAFARSIVDSVLMMMGRDDFTYVSQGREHIEAANETGGILLSAHVGARASGDRRLGHLNLHLVMYENEAKAIQAVLDKAAGDNQPSVIAINDGPAAAVQILKVLKKREIVAMLADRHRDGATYEIDFLGAPARFPVGPFRVAVLSKAPVIFTFGYKNGPAEQCFYALPPISLGAVARPDREAAAESLARRYVAALEEYVRAHPYQWFNFYDFWA